MGARVQQQLLSNIGGTPSVPGPLLVFRIRRPLNTSARATEMEESDASNPETTRGAVTEGSLV